MPVATVWDLTHGRGQVSPPQWSLSAEDGQKHSLTWPDPQGVADGHAGRGRFAAAGGAVRAERAGGHCCDRPGRYLCFL